MGLLFLWGLSENELMLRSLIVLAVCFACVEVSFRWLSDNASKVRGVYVPPPQYIKYLHFGYGEAMADSFWIRAIQDFDYCEKPQGEMIRTEEEILAEEVKANKDQLNEEFAHLMKNITTQNKGFSTCSNGWLSQMLDATTELAPRFKIVYLTGATSLSVVLNDYVGATKLFNKGIEQFPDDWRLPYHAAYHFMYDRQDLARAAELLKMAAEKGAPPWVNSLAARAFTASGQGELAIRTLMEFRKFTKGDLKEKVDARIQKIREILVKQKESDSSTEKPPENP